METYKKAFKQIRIRELERSLFRFHWIKNLDPNVLDTNRFTKLVFGLTQSPFMLEGTLKQHFQRYMNEYPIVIQKFQNVIYINDLVSGGPNLAEIENLKQKSIELFSNRGINLHKWHSNIPNSEQTYARELFSSNSDHKKNLKSGLE